MPKKCLSPVFNCNGGLKTNRIGLKTEWTEYEFIGEMPEFLPDVRSLCRKGRAHERPRTFARGFSG